MLGPFDCVRDVGDHRLDARAVVVALAVDLLGLRQQRLDALAELDERVARVRLLDDPGDHLADAVLVLVEHHVALGLADPLEDHLLGRLRGDAAEVVGGDVALVDLIGVLGQHLGRDLGLGGLAHLAGLGVDPALLDLDLLEQPLLEVGGHQQLVDAEVRGLAAPCRRGRTSPTRLLLVGGEQRVLERAISRSAEIPFSRSRTCTASTISRDIALPPSTAGPKASCRAAHHGSLSVRQEVAAVDVDVGDRHDPGVGGHRDLLIGGAHQLAGERGVPVTRLARANPGAAADEATEVVGLGERAARDPARRPRARPARAGPAGAR